jgi:hypothetical protein
MSTTQSCWLLDRTNEIVSGTTPTNTSPADSGFTLPDGVSVWATSSGISYSKTYVPTYDNGYLVYAGSTVTMENINTSDTTSGLFSVVLPNYFPTANVSSLLVTLADDDATTTYTLEIPMTGLTSGVKTGSVLFYTASGEILSMTAALDQSSSGGGITVSLNIPDLSLSVDTVMPGGMTDTIRYIRAKV